MINYLCPSLYALVYYRKVFKLTGSQNKKIKLIEVVHMLRMKKVSETYDLKVFTDSGEYFGDVEDSIIAGNKVFGWKIRATKNSFLSRVLGSARGVIVPHQLVRAVGDVLLISKSAIPSGSGEPSEEPAA